MWSGSLFNPWRSSGNRGCASSSKHRFARRTRSLPGGRRRFKCRCSMMQGPFGIARQIYWIRERTADQTWRRNDFPQTQAIFNLAVFAPLLFTLPSTCTMARPKILIVGCGAVGMTQGYILSSGADITYLVRPGRTSAFKGPKKLYDYKENALHTFDNYRLIESPSDVADEEFFCVLGKYYMNEVHVRHTDFVPAPL